MILAHFHFHGRIRAEQTSDFTPNDFPETKISIATSETVFLPMRSRKQALWVAAARPAENEEKASF